QFLSKIGFKSLRMYNSVTKQMRKSARMNRMCSRFIAMHESMRNRREVSHAFHLWCSKIRTVVDRRREEELWKKSVKFHETQTKKHCFLAWRRYVAGSFWRSSHHALLRTPSLVQKHTLPIPSVTQQVTDKVFAKTISTQRRYDVSERKIPRFGRFSEVIKGSPQPRDRRSAAPPLHATHDSILTVSDLSMNESSAPR
ncbi:hypothetical protein ADUPG1_013815, partial [Aduncisulcus paluster]